MCLVLPSLAQDAPALPEIRVTSRPYTPRVQQFTAESNLVEARVVVLDPRGAPVAGLARPDFQLFVDGRPTAFTGFSVETAPAVSAPSAAAAGRGTHAAPIVTVAAARRRYVALFMDDLSLDTAGIMAAREAARKLKASDLSGSVRLGIFTSSGAMALPFTAATTEWEATLDKLQYRARMPRQGIVPGTSFSSEFAYWVQQDTSDNSQYTGLAEARVAAAGLCITHDACHDVAIADSHATVNAATAVSSDIIRALQRAITALAAQDGDRILILTSTGFFTDTLTARLEAVTNQALRDKVVIDSLDARGLEPDQPSDKPLEQMVATNETVGLDAPLATLADATGGTFIQNTNNLAGALSRLAAQPEIAYALSFSPASLPYDGKFHTIKVAVAAVRHAAVQTRKGFYDPAPEDNLFRAASPTAVDAAVLGPTHGDDLPVKFSTAWSHGNLRINVRLSPARLHFNGCDDGRRCENLVFTSAVFDQQGRFVIGKTGAMGLELTDSGYTELIKTGLGANLNLRLPAGVYRMREVVQEGNRGDFVAFDQVIRPGA